MRRDTGEIISESEAAALNLQHPGLAVPMQLPPTRKQHRFGKVGRNDPCPCGSGKKFKRCCKSPDVTNQRPHDPALCDTVRMDAVDATE